MNTTELKIKLNEIRSEAVSIIKGILEDAGITELVLEEAVGTGDYPMLHNEEGEGSSLASINIDEKGNLWFESDSEFDTLCEGEDDLSVDALLEIAEWVEEYEDDIRLSAQEEEE